jgi:hypothetical protein
MRYKRQFRQARHVTFCESFVACDLDKRPDAAGCQLLEPSPLNGVVLGLDDVPLAGAEVELPALQLFTHTDYKGRFHFPTAAPGP